MDRITFRRLLGPDGRAAVRQAEDLSPSEEEFLAGLTALERRGVEHTLARAALETVLLRRLAAAKFTRAGDMFFLREALEQASSEELARHRAGRFIGARRIADLGCGIGGDTLALAEQAPVAAVDREEVRLWMARENVAAYRPRHPAAFFLADLTAEGVLAFPELRKAAVFCDPARREDGRRVFSVRRYSPPLGVLTAWQAVSPDRALCVKISPGVRWEEIEREPCEVEFVSLRRELKEAVLWYGPFRSAGRRATLLPADETLTDGQPGSDAVSPPGRVLYEPDPSILRAGLVRQLAGVLGAGRIDPEIAYLTADEHTPTPWARVYAVEEVMPFGVKRLREWLRARGVGRVTVKKRGSPVEPDELERQLRLRGDGSRIVFLTRAGGKPVVLISTGEIR
jgi:SAM-dependent methyltransferase